MNKKIKKIEIVEDSDLIAIKVHCYEELSDTSKDAFIKAFGVVYAKELWGANIDCNVDFVKEDLSDCDGNYRERNFEAHED
jgi:hypothetical protein